MLRQHTSSHFPSTIWTPIVALSILVRRSAAELIEAPHRLVVPMAITTKISTYMTLVSHGLIFDACMIIPMFFKGHRHYLESHKSLFYLFVALLLVEFILLFQDAGQLLETQLSLVIFATMVGQYFVGSWVERIITRKNNGDRHSVQKMAHKVLAFIQFVIVKAQMYIALNRLITGKLFLIIWWSYLGANLLVYLLFAVFRRRPVKRQRVQLQYDKTEYRDVLKSLELNEINPFESYSSPKDKTVLENESVISEKFVPEIQWFLVENRVVALKEFNHPGGDFLLAKFSRRDLTPYLSGQMSFPYFVKNIGKVIFFKHKHGSFMREHVRRHSFGFHSDHIMQNAQRTDNTQEINSDPANAFFCPNDASFQTNLFFDEVPEREYDLEFQVQFPACESTLMFVSRSGLDNGGFIVDLTKYWVPSLGKYVMLGVNNKEVSFGYPVMSLTPNYRKIRSRTLMMLNHSLFNYQSKFVTPDLVRLEQKSDALERKKTSKIFPVFIQTRVKNQSFNLKVSNLYGYGISHLTRAADRILVIVKDEGIVPFLDFLEVATHFFILEDCQSDKTDMVFTKDYLYLFSNHPVFVFKWVVTGRFSEAAKTLGLWQLQFLMEAQKLRVKTSKPDIFERVYIHSETVDCSYYDNLTKKGYETDKFTVLAETKDNPYDRIVVCGDDDWRVSLFSDARMDNDQFNKIIFI